MPLVRKKGNNKMTTILSIGGLSASRGTKVQGFIRIYDTDTQMPVTLINGTKDGKTILITGGIHGGEYPGILTAIELAQELDPVNIAGQLIIVHPVNTQAFAAKTPEVVPGDRKNINRVFPGDKEGTIADKIAYTLTHDFQKKADFYIDLHGGDLFERVTPYVYYPGIAKDEVVNISKRAAKVLDVAYMVKSTATTGAYNSAAIHGVPSILIERGGQGLWNRLEVDSYKNDVLNILKHLKVIAGELVPNQHTPIDVINPIYLTANNSGCWYPCVNAGAPLIKGQMLGEVKDFFGNTLDTYYSQMVGVVLYLTTSLAVSEGDSLVAYAEFSL